MQRSLHYPLAPYDQIFFLHIPKTAGTTLFEILRTYFSPENVLSFRIAEMDQESYQQLMAARLIRAHVGYEIYRFLVRPPVFLTMLRHPLERVISSYAAARRPSEQRPIPYAGSLEEFVNLPANRNLQTYRIAGSQHNLRHASPETILSIAKIHLSQFPFFGITERFDESLRLLHHIFSWSFPGNYTSQNVSGIQEKPVVTSDIRDMILEHNTLDLELYSFAQTAFEARLETLKTELSA